MVIMDVEATTAIRQAEVGATKTMLDRTAEQSPRRAWSPIRVTGSAEMIGWLADLVASGFVNGARDLGCRRVRGSHLGLSGQAWQLCLCANGFVPVSVQRHVAGLFVAEDREAYAERRQMPEIAKPEALLGELSRLD
jgi:hypothetical protein